MRGFLQGVVPCAGRSAGGGGPEIGATTEWQLARLARLCHPVDHKRLWEPPGPMPSDHKM